MSDSIGSEVFPVAGHLFRVWAEPIAAIHDTSLVVFDTNALLVPYLVVPSSLSDIGLALRKLRDAERVFIPSQVAREFVRLRAAKIAELSKAIASVRSDAGPRILPRYPLLDSTPEMRAAQGLQATAQSAAREYRDAVGKLSDVVAQWRWNDPVSQLYASVFDDSCVVSPSISKADFDSDVERRFTHNIPPGYKDKGKDDGGFGDVAIWHTILELGRTHKRHLIFVTGEEKPDWWHRSDGPLFPRFELVEEYWRESGGRSFHIATLSHLLELLQASAAVVDEVRKEERVIVEQVPAALAPEAPDAPFHERVWKARLAVRQWIVNRFGAKALRHGAGDSLYHIVADSLKPIAVRVEYREVDRWFDRGRFFALLRDATYSQSFGVSRGFVLWIISDSSERCALIRQSMEELLPMPAGITVLFGFLKDNGELVETSRFEGDPPAL
ncbi:MAG: PIN-like domain-containing protein [Pseudomonadota bacterium]|jgi:hypothetical protein